MNKPQGYEEAQAFGEFETLPAGGHKCVIKKVTCSKTQSEKEFLKIEFDIAEGKYKDFFRNKFAGDTRPEPKWSGVWAVFLEGYNQGTTNPKFKGLITSVEASNPNFKFDFNEEGLVEKKVGIVFREEEFEGQDGQVHSTAKPFFAISYENVEKAKIPEPKKLTSKNAPFENTTSTITDEELPF